MSIGKLSLRKRSCKALLFTYFIFLFPFSRISLTCFSFGYGGTNAHTILDDAGHYLESRGVIGHHNTVMGDHFCHATRGHPSNSHVTSNGNGISNDNNLVDGSSVLPCVDLPRLFVWSSNELSGLTRSFKAMLGYLFEYESSPRDEYTFLDQLALTLGEKRSRLP